MSTSKLKSREPRPETPIIIICTDTLPLTYSKTSKSAAKGRRAGRETEAEKLSSFS
jgi:hypothetical protein